MYHSLTFANKNTWDAWHLMPKSRPVVNPPKPKTQYVDIPGADGSLDYTEALGSVKYNNREGSWSFYVMNDYGEKNYDYDYWWQLYSTILAHVHGRKMLIWSEDDPEYVYSGRLTVNEWASNANYSEIAIDYVLDPYKYRGKVNEDGSVEKDTSRSTASNDWLWDELFDNTIIYGKFNVLGSKQRTLINETDNKELEIAVTCSNDMIAIVNNDAKHPISLQNGKNRDSGIILQSPKTIVQFEGNGLVTIDYDKDGVIL